MFDVIIVKSEEDWHKLRSTVLTATEVSIILGLNKYESVKDLILKKAGKGPKFQGNSYTIVGQLLEPVIVAATNLTLDSDYMLYEQKKDEKYFFYDNEIGIGATPDAHDQESLLECKSTTPKNFLTYANWPPINYICQLYTQMICTDIEVGYLSVMCNNLAPKSPTSSLPLSIFGLTRTKFIDQTILSEVKRYWNTLENNKTFRVNRKLSADLELRLRLNLERIHP